ncbi:O-antigen ligase family protein [Hymenobacter volaticus]|uniref:O-antigen ligase family protein n=1 Tax=Hymenobacter volaticus TaxID=2932254 RepID=A0ABY4GAC5_9BACT|nr:O-antigen ligase family protein [Hymenobacter volaticus]UOQ67715.1 O-antigen ligase family protein [Hymenobacter volaticus]
MNFLASLRPQNSDQRLFMAFVVVVLVAGVGTIASDSIGWLALPAAVLGAAVLLIDWRWVYYLLLGTLAFSREVQLPAGLSMDVPSEPLMLVLLGCFTVNVLLGRSQVPGRLWRHPLVLLIGAALLWSVASTISSVDTLKSIKYLLAKTWYIVPFVFVTMALVRTPRDVWRFVAFYGVGVSITVVYTMVRHAGMGFGFDTINVAIQPFYRNHVIYAAAAALLAPYAFFAARDAVSKKSRRLWYIAFFLAVAGVSLSYTRASVLALIVAVLYYWVIRLRLTKITLVGATLATILGVNYFISGNNYMEYAPDYEKTIFYGNNFQKHLEATYNLEDVSGMERVYRWVAAAHMIIEKPIIGSGPSTFYPEYKRYTVRSFQTYVSDNPEKSTTHNYFLLQLAEQGIPGFVLFTVLVFATLVLIERIYHRARSAQQQNLVMAAGLSFVVIVFHLLLNELLEVDKIGSLYYISLAVLMRIQFWQEDEADEAVQLPATEQQ